MAEGSNLEKIEQPSQHRRNKSREEGQAARSREMATFVLLMAGGAELWFMGSVIIRKLVKLIHDGLTLDKRLTYDSDHLLPHLYTLAIDALSAVFPFLLMRKNSATKPSLL